MLKSFAKLLAGNVAVQITVLLFYPILGRIYSPEEFGFFGIISSLAIVLSIFSNGQLHMAFPQLEENSIDGKSLLKLCLTYTTATTFVIATLSYLGAFKFLISEERLAWYFIAIFIFAFSLSEITKMWIVYLRKYGLSSIFVTSNRLISNLLKIGFPKSLGLIYSEILSNFISVFVIFKFTKVNFKETSSLRKTLKRFSHYPLLYTFGSLAQALQLELPVFMFKKIFAANVVGLYVMANKFTVQSVILVSSSLILVLANKRVSNKEERVMSEVKRILKVVTPLSIIIFLLLKFFAQNFFTVFLGSKWNGIGEIASYLSLLVLPKMLYVPIYAEILREGRVKLLTYLRGTQVLLSLALFQVFKEMDFISLLKIYVAFDFITDAIVIVLSLYFINSSRKSDER